ncbi:secreted frizzled-related protein 3-like isoform X2 [Liolophura sinensis]|uniref:secreted frizzled-related protein 3-like isoform X2 n=1 Tax=Liolophura sinensis TaxID=3198878 RepID=UPI0031593C85
MKQFKLFVLSVLLAVPCLSTVCSACEVVRIPMCKRMPYNMTRMPNLLHHSTQENAILAIEQFEELVDQNCSDVLLFFLCAMYAPICTYEFLSDAIPPCKGVCENARVGCEPIMNEYNVSWPEGLDCKDLPLYDRGVCVSPEAIVSTLPDENGGKGLTPGKSPGNQDEWTNRGRSPDCKCPKQARPNRNLYRKNGYNFAMQAKPIHSLRTGNRAVTRVQVLSAPVVGKVPIKIGSSVELWSNFTCICPELVLNKEYLILGFEDGDQAKLLYLENSIAVPWRKKWESRVKWAKRRKGRRSRKGRRNGRKRGGKRSRRRGRKTDKKIDDGKSGKGKNRKSRRQSGRSSRRKKPRRVCHAACIFWINWVIGVCMVSRIISL